MIFKQFRYEPLGQASYLLGCPRAKEAFVVDPIADLGPDFYIVEAADLTLGIVGVLLTDNQELRIGQVRVQVLFTPGHHTGALQLPRHRPQSWH